MTTKRATKGTQKRRHDRARAIAQVASVLVDTAKVEVDYLKATGQDNSNFIDGMKTPPQIHNGSVKTEWADDTPKRLAQV